MLCGLYNCEGGSVRELDAMHRLKQTAEGAELFTSGPLAVAFSATSAGGFADVDGIHCVLDGAMYEPATLAQALKIPASNQAQLVACAYRRNGPAMLSTLRGRFSLVVWDRRHERGLLSCDILATRQLFRCRRGRALLFATELDELMRILSSRPGPDPLAFVTWLGGEHCPDGRTLYEGVSRFSPGQFIPLGEGPTEPRTYWRPRYAGTLEGSREELAEGLGEQLERAITRRLSPRGTGVVLSGGLDSSIVAALGARATPPGAQIGTYSAVFPGREFDEGWKVRELTDALGIVPATFQIEPRGVLWLAVQHTMRWQLPLSGAAAVVDMAIAAEAARDGMEVLMDGQLGDEVLGFSPFLLADRLVRGRLSSAIELTERWPVGRAGTRRERLWALQNFGLKPLVPYPLLRFVRTHRDLQGSGPRWLLPALREQYAEWEDVWAWKRYAAGPLWWRFLADLLVNRFHRDLRHDYLRHRAKGLGVANESPFCDPDLIEYVLQLPAELAFAQLDRPLAREAMRGILPDQVRLQKQKAVFLEFCMDAVTGADARGIERLLTARDAELGAYVDLEWVRNLWYRERPPPQQSAYWLVAIWCFVMCELWLRAQADPGFLEQLLARPDVLAPSVQAVGDQPAIAPFSH